MNVQFARVIGASDRDRRDLFVTTATRMGFAAENVEKDFWVCWLLDAFFNGLPADSPKRLFKGGTSLAKAFRLVERFSEDVDVAIFREDLGEDASIESMLAMSGQKRKAKLEAILAACQGYIQGPLLTQLRAVTESVMTSAGVPGSRWKLDLDLSDPDGQSLLLEYPAVIAGGGYVQAAVKLEGGARSALEPVVPKEVTPHVDADLPGAHLTVTNVITIEPQRTFWDKVVLLHGLRQWFDRRGELLHGGQRVSRHYYDVHTLLAAPKAAAWVDDRALGRSCAQHARLFFYRPDFNLDAALDGNFTLVPGGAMEPALRDDYVRMAGMIFKTPPDFGAMLASVAALEARLRH